MLTKQTRTTTARGKDITVSEFLNGPALAGELIQWDAVGTDLGNAVVRWAESARLTRPLEGHLGLDRFHGDHTMSDVNADVTQGEL